jgi:hypothetical protein
VRTPIAAVTVLLLAPAAAAQHMFHGLDSPVLSQGGLAITGISDDGQRVVGHHLTQSTYLGQTYLTPSGLRWLPGGAVQNAPNVPVAITPDGEHIVGTTPAYPPTADQWGWQATWGGAYLIPPWPIGNHLNWFGVGQAADGSRVLGRTPDGLGLLIKGGQVISEIAPSPGYTLFSAESISGDGEVVGGRLRIPGQDAHPVYWTAQGFQSLVSPPVQADSVFVSRGGSHFTGTYVTPTGRRAFWANRSGNLYPLGLANFSENWGTCISAQGDVVGGYGWQPVEQRHRAIIWNRAAGTRDLKTVLIQLGLQDVVLWRLTNITAISGDGAWLAGTGINPFGQPSAWAARIPPFCYANCDSSTTSPVLNVSDFNCFLTRFANGDAYANCDRSTTAPALNISDFVCFLQHFAAGCPQ